MKISKRIHAAILLGISGVLCLSTNAQWSHQGIDLEEGWNAIYLTVQPVSNSCETVFKDWPIESVSLYSAPRASGQFVESPDEKIIPEPEYLIWHPGNAAASSLKSVLGGQAYLIKATANHSATLYGNPVVPRTRWIPSDDAVNLMGFCVGADGAYFSTYFDGVELGISKVYTVSGSGASPVKLPIGGFTGGLSGPIVPGKAYFIQSSKVSDFCGPLRVSPAGYRGLDFYEGITCQQVYLENESTEDLDVIISHVASAALPGKTAPAAPPLLIYDQQNGWTNFLGTSSHTLSAGEIWTVRLAVDRTAMESGREYGSIIACSDSRGGLVKVPLFAAYAEPDGNNALWPAGLWVGDAYLNEVSYVGTNTVVDGVAAGGVMKYRLIVHVDVDGNSRLLQRVIVAGMETDDGEWGNRIYLDDALVPDGVQSVRISATAFSLKNNMADGTGGFGDALDFGYVIAHDDPANPFLHPYHPDHDGLESDFKTALPSGNSYANYIGEIKPETFSISNSVSMVWSTTHQNATAGSALWSPEEKVSGSYAHTVHGLRREGAIRMNGTFVLRRVSKVGTISTN